VVAQTGTARLARPPPLSPRAALSAAVRKLYCILTRYLARGAIRLDSPDVNLIQPGWLLYKGSIYHL
jgi:hypothetical protein